MFHRPERIIPVNTKFNLFLLQKCQIWRWYWWLVLYLKLLPRHRSSIHVRSGSLYSQLIDFIALIARTVVHNTFLTGIVSFVMYYAKLFPDICLSAEFGFNMYLSFQLSMKVIIQLQYSLTHSRVFHDVQNITQSSLHPTQPNPPKIKKLWPNPNPTQPMDGSNPWPTLVCHCFNKRTWWWCT